MHAPWLRAPVFSQLFLLSLVGAKYHVPDFAAQESAAASTAVPPLSSDAAHSPILSKLNVATSVVKNDRGDVATSVVQHASDSELQGSAASPQTDMARTRRSEPAASGVTSLSYKRHTGPANPRDVTSLGQRTEVKTHSEQNTTQPASTSIVVPVEPPGSQSPLWVVWWQSISLFLIIKTLCMISNITFQVSPFPLVKKIREDKDTGEIDAAPLVSIAYGCCQWTFYGALAWHLTQQAGFLVIVYANCLGSFFGVFYVVSYHVNCKHPESYANLMLYYKAILSLVLAQAIGLATLPSSQVLFMCGLVSSCCSVVSGLSPLTVVPTVLRTRCSAVVPLPLVVASTVSAVLWIICGIMLWDSWITTPNLFATCVNLYLLSLVLKYPRDEQESIQKWARWDVQKKVPPKLRLAFSSKDVNNAKDLDTLVVSLGAKEAADEKTPLCSTGESPDVGGTF